VFKLFFEHFAACYLKFWLVDYFDWKVFALPDWLQIYISYVVKSALNKLSK